MKVKIAYKPEEEKKVAASVAAIQRLNPGAKIRRSDRHAPFIHIYITTERQEGHTCKNGENVV